MNYISIQSSRDVIQHFGTKGMRWGHRKSKEFYTRKYINKGYNPKAAREKANKRVILNKRLKTSAKIAGGVALAGLAAYGAYKGLNHLKSNAARIAADNLAVKERNKRIWAEINAEKMRKTNEDLDALHKRGQSIRDLYRKRSEEIKNLNKDWSKELRRTTTNSIMIGANGRRIKDVTDSLR